MHIEKEIERKKHITNNNRKILQLVKNKFDIGHAIEDDDVLEYVSSFAEELANLCRVTNNAFLAYLLDMTAMEARATRAPQLAAFQRPA